MKIALCLAGQYRTFNNEVVQKTIKHFLLDQYDCDVYISTWKNRGVSLNHGNILNQDDQSDIIRSSDILNYIPVKNIEIEDYDLWYQNLNENSLN